MPDGPFYTNEAALTEADLVALTIADPAATPTPLVGHVRLFDASLVPGPLTTKANLVAAEITLTGYPVGGYPLTGFAAAIFAPGGGAVIQSNLIQVKYTSGPAATVGGYWVEDHNGDVREVFLYDPQRGLTAVGDGWPIVVQFGYGRNNA